MSKNINVNPGQYKVAGRERQGEDILQGVAKRRLTQSRETQRWENEPPSGQSNDVPLPDRPMPASRKVAGAFGRQAKRVATKARSSRPAGRTPRAAGSDSRGAVRRAKPRRGAKASLGTKKR